jgi:uncharacterized protein YidB (DUF937 family)
MPTSRVAGSQGDPLGSLLGGAGGLGGLLAGGAAGGLLGDLLKQFDQSGQGAAARSWVSSSENVPVTPNDIEKTFGPDIINQLADQFGMDKSELLQGLSQTLPGVVDQLTPDGRLPTEDEISRWKEALLLLGWGLRPRPFPFEPTQHPRHWRLKRRDVDRQQQQSERQHPDSENRQEAEHSAQDQKAG